MPEYLVRKKLLALGDDSWVENERGERIFHIDGKVLRLRDTYVLQSVDGEELLKITQRLKLRKTFVIERDGEQIATVAKALVSPLRDRFTVDVAGRGTVEARGNLLDHEFTLEWEGGARMAEVSKRWFSVSDAYGVSVAPTQDSVLAIAIAVCIDASERDG